jgi:uncharacterized protein (TIGR02996 family)
MHESFLAAIRHEWGDPFPILSYADWLEEQGDSRSLAMRALAAGPREFSSQLTCEGIFDAQRGHRFRVRTAASPGFALDSDDATPVFERFTLWYAEQALLRARQDGQQLPPLVDELLEVKRRWLRGAATRNELRVAGERAWGTPQSVHEAMGVATRQAFETHYHFAYLHDDRQDESTLTPVDELGLRLCSECHWQRAAPPLPELQSQVERKGPLDCITAARCLLQASRLLVQVHAKHGVHRDLRPRHLVLDAGDVVALLSRSTLARHPHDILGDETDYLAPDSAIDSHSLPPCVDVYSLGCILCFLILGRPPFSGGTPAQRLVRHQTEAPPSLQPAGAPAGLRFIYQRLMEKRSYLRYQTAGEVVAVLEGWLREHPTS